MAALGGVLSNTNAFYVNVNRTGFVSQALLDSLIADTSWRSAASKARRIFARMSSVARTAGPASASNKMIWRGIDTLA